MVAGRGAADGQPMTAASIRVEQLSIHSTRGHVLVRDVSFSVQPGRTLVVIGETGSGKSLIAQALMGILPPGLAAIGMLHMPGRPAVALSDPDALSALWADETMLLPQEPAAALDPTMKVGRQLRLPGRGTRAATDAVLASLDLDAGIDDAYPFSLSGGMAQRVLIGCAIGSAARLVIADEPTKGLDPARVERVIALLRGLAKQGRALVVITHDLAVARGLPGDVLVLRDGEAIEAGPTASVLATPRHSYTSAWLAADPSAWPACRPCLERDDLVLAAHGLSFAWPRARPLFRDLDLHVPRGGVLALMGESGSGKTTLGNILLGLRRPDEGTVSWQGADPYRDPRARLRLRQRYQKLHQDPGSALLPHRMVVRQMEDLCEVKPELDLVAALPPLLDRLKLAPGLLQRYPAEISGGEAQRLAILRLLLLEPDFILADEPTSRLDPIVQRETMLLLRQVVEEQRLGLVLVSHDRALVNAVSDEVITIG
jgi:peptide/nickel transport system ATP-binding protein